VTDELDRLAAACVFPGFEGLEPPDWVRRAIGEGVHGFVLFARNVRDPEQVTALTASLRSERPDLLVSIDEEGGDVTRLEADTGSSYPGNLALGAVDDVTLTEAVARAIAGDLTAAGINLDLAPVADVNTNPRNPTVGVRSFGSDPELVARHVAAFVAGLQGAGVGACAKHFPGHGATETDSHLELPTAELSDDALAPFRAAIDAGVVSIMTAHIRVLGVDDRPATLSPRIIGDLLRGELGFEGVVMTDALEMRAISATVGVDEGAVLALVAGADALCLGYALGERDVGRTRRAIVDAVGQGRLGEERLAEAAARVQALGRRTAFRAAPMATEATGRDAARRALRARGETTLVRPPLVVELRPEPSIAAGETRHGLADYLTGAETVRIEENGVVPASVLDGRHDRQLLLVLRDAHRHPWQQTVAERLVAAAPDAIVVETGVPVWRPAAAGSVDTHGASRASLAALAELLSR
jgi:beta-N-acetylhexosaminidase